jgi:hypothetical protein
MQWNGHGRSFRRLRLIVRTGRSRWIGRNADLPLRGITQSRCKPRLGAASEPNAPGESVPPYVGGTANTGQGATCSKRCVTLPSKRHEPGSCPRVPATISPAPASLAGSAMACAALLRWCRALHKRRRGLSPSDRGPGAAHSARPLLRPPVRGIPRAAKSDLLDVNRYEACAVRFGRPGSRRPRRRIARRLGHP